MVVFPGIEVYWQKRIFAQLGHEIAVEDRCVRWGTRVDVRVSETQGFDDLLDEEGFARSPRGVYENRIGSIHVAKQLNELGNNFAATESVVL